jgi:Flp pilus assembly protein TadD
LERTSTLEDLIVITRLRNFGLGFLTLSGIYLYAFPSASIPYLGLVLLHIAGGFLFAAVLLLSVRKEFWGQTPNSPEHFVPSTQSSPANSVSVPKTAWAVTAVGAALGIGLAFTGGARPWIGLLYSHIVISVLGVVLVLVASARLAHRLGTQYSPAVRFSGLLLLAILLGSSAWVTRQATWNNSHRIENPETPPESQDFEGAGMNGDFFPSSVQTNTGEKISSEFFMQSEACKRCHSDIYDQWNSSAHHFSSFNNQWYRKSIEYMQDVIGVKPSRWCAGCHDPALLFSGKFDTPAREIVNTPEAQAGLGCVMCHSIASVNSTMGQGDFTVEYPALAKLAASENRFMRVLHDFLVEVNPEPHRRTFMRPFLRQDVSDFCSSCHKVHLDQHVNNYRWVRGFNDYDAWQGSGVSGMGARSFYYPPQSRRCTDCHMPVVDSNDAGNVNGKVHSHRFPGANTALPLVNRDQKQMDAVTRFLQDGILSVDIFALSPARAEVSGGGSAIPVDSSSSFAIGEEGELRSAGVTLEVAPVTAPIDRVAAEVTPGETYRVDVVVRTRKIGHFFPGGTVDAFDVWLELEAKDDAGRVIFSSGALENGNGAVDKGAHMYRSLQVDANGNPINKRNAWSMRSLVYVRLIPPGAADTVHYRLKIPENLTGKIHLKTRMLYRKFAWWNTQFAFAGERAPGAPPPTMHADEGKWSFTADTSQVSGQIKAIPDLPVVTIAEDTATLDVASGPSRQAPATRATPTTTINLDPKDWERWNDYGIGLFLQGDLKGAEAAFLKATEIAPKNPDGWVNIGRARQQEGNLEGAREVLKRALEIAPNLARAHYFYGRVLRDEGKYDEALTHMRLVARQYPKDRVVLNDTGRLLFLQRKYQAAVEEFKAVLAIDPEDLQAHYNLMLCYNGLGMQQQALEHQKRYLRFKADESAQAITGPYRLAHPEDNNERQTIHEHGSAPLAR